MHNDNRRIGKRCSRVRFSDGGVVPRSYLAEVDSGEDLRRKFEFTFKSRNVVRGNHRAQNCRKMKNACPSLLLESGDLLILHGAVAGSEVNSASSYLRNSAAAANRLVVDLNIGVLLMVFIKPFRVDRIREGGTRCVELGLRYNRKGQCKQRDYRKEPLQCFFSSVELLSYPDYKSEAVKGR